MREMSACVDCPLAEPDMAPKDSEEGAEDPEALGVNEGKNADEDIEGTDEEGVEDIVGIDLAPSTKEVRTWAGRGGG